MPESEAPRIKCANCDKTYAWSPKIAGKKARCQCGVTIVIPADMPPSEPIEAEESYDIVDDPAPPPPQRPVASDPLLADASRRSRTRVSAAKERDAVDDRTMREIEVTWPLLLFMGSIFGLPILCAPIYVAFTGDHVPPIVLVGSWILAVLCVGLMIGVLVWCVRDSRGEYLPDGTPRTRWVLRQLAMGLGFCVLAGVVVAIYAMRGNGYGGVRGGIVATPGILMIGRVLARK